MVSGSLGCPGCLLSAGCMHCCMLVSDWLQQKEGNSKWWLLQKWREIQTNDVKAMLNGSQMASIDVETRCRGYLMTMAGFLCRWQYLADLPGQMFDWRGQFVDLDHPLMFQFEHVGELICQSMVLCRLMPGCYKSFLGSFSPRLDRQGCCQNQRRLHGTIQRFSTHWKLLVGCAELKNQSTCFWEILDLVFVSKISK